MRPVVPLQQSTPLTDPARPAGLCLGPTSWDQPRLRGGERPTAPAAPRSSEPRLPAGGSAMILLLTPATPPLPAPVPPCRPPHCPASPRCAEEAERGGNLRLSLMRLPERASSGEGRAAPRPRSARRKRTRSAANSRPAQRACLRRGGGRKSCTVSPLRAAAVPARAAAGGAGCSACHTAVPCPAVLRGTPGRDRLVNGLGAAAFNQTGLRKGVFQRRSARGAQPESVLNPGVGFPASCCRCV